MQKEEEAMLIDSHYQRGSWFADNRCWHADNCRVHSALHQATGEHKNDKTAWASPIPDNAHAVLWLLAAGSGTLKMKCL